MAISFRSSAIGVRILQILKQLNVETHVIISKWGAATMKYETDFTMRDLQSYATHVYPSKNVAAAISSGSFLHDGMIVAPCSMKTLAGIRAGYTEDLIVRAADVTLKEKRRLLLVPRETPLSEVHLDNMLSLAKMGATIFPPVPAFYTKPESVDDIIEQSCGRILDCFGIHINTFNRWNGF
ncbi:related to 3-octaprenyl-4-hydroxybenzoate carboxy-lyase [Zygosaccharomyces bailii]|nr:related to 3-octaprenyl-4-hydroxybenzoate carboxy-lyase [Zygosaccharomyces bailii]